MTDNQTTDDNIPNKISRAAALIELNGETFVLNLSSTAWHEILSIAARDAGGQLPVARVPNQSILDQISSR